MPDPDPRDQVETVLIVDDDAIVRSAIAEYLRDCGFRVIEAAHAGEAQSVLLDDTVRVDIVLSAAAMRQGIDGFALFQWAREHRPDVEVVLAGTPGRAANAAAELCDSGPMLARPYDPQVVLDRIRRMLAAKKRRPNDK
jgi:DNA-binding NtrC family response regulator